MRSQAPIATARISTADVLESGYPAPGFTRSGWLNRALAALPKGDRVAAMSGLGVGPETPLVLRGSAPVLGWAPENLPHASDDLATRLLDLYAHRDPALAEALSRGLEIEKIALRQGMEDGGTKSRQGYDTIAGMRHAAQGAASLMAADDGPRIAALAFDGWDTHANEGGASGRLAQLLGGLDGAFGNSRRASARFGKIPLSSPSPSSAAPPALTAPRAPTTARERLPSWPAARSRAAASSPIGRA